MLILHEMSRAPRWARLNARASRLRPLLQLSCVLLLMACGDAPEPDSALEAPNATRTGARTVPYERDAWIRAGEAGATTGGYAIIFNPRRDSLVIVGASSVVADTVEIHETMQHDGMVHMTPQPSLTIARADSLALRPGGKHFMLRNLKRAVVPGETVTIRVYFNDRTSLDVLCDVRPIGG